MVGGNWLKSIFFLFLYHLPGFPNYTFLNFQKNFFSLHPNDHCLYYVSPFRSCFLPRLFRSSSITAHFKFQSLRYYIFSYPQNITVSSVNTQQYLINTNRNAEREASFSHPIKYHGKHGTELYKHLKNITTHLLALIFKHSLFIRKL